MRKWIYALLVLALLLPAAGLAEEAACTLVYDEEFHLVSMALLPGAPVKASSDQRGMPEGWTRVGIPDTRVSDIMGYIEGEIPAATEPSTWPKAKVVKACDLESTNGGVGYGDLAVGETLYVFGRDSGYWFVCTEDGQMGAVMLGELDVDLDAWAKLNAALPWAAKTGEELEAWQSELENMNATLYLTYGAKENWPREKQLEYDELSWKAGAINDDAMMLQPGEGDMTEAEAVAIARAYVTAFTEKELPKDVAYTASFQLDRGAWTPAWHLTFPYGNMTLPFRVDMSGFVDLMLDSMLVMDRDYRFTWTLEEKKMAAQMMKWPLENDQSPEEGSMAEEEIRTLARRQTMTELQVNVPESDLLVELKYYAAGTMPESEWATESWCKEKAVYKAVVCVDNQTDDPIFASEVWLDAVDGTIYYAVDEPTGNG